MIGRTLLALSLVVLSAAPVRAEDPLVTLLLHAPDPATLRSELAGFAARQSPADSVAAARAWGLMASSYHRAGLADSAIACGERAAALHPEPESADALIDALLTRNAPGDVAQARALLTRRFTMLRYDAGPWDMVNTQGRAGWALFLAGNVDSARKTFDRQRRLTSDANPMGWVWRRRIAIAANAAGDGERALEMCKDLAVRSMLQDRDALTLLDQVLGGSQGDERYVPFLRSEITHAQQADLDRLARMHARRLKTTAADGFPLSGVLFDPPAGARHVLIAFGRSDDDLAWYDSLSTGLGRSGCVLVVMDPRGSGRSLGPTCPSPESWDGREEAIERLVAGDARWMFAAVAREVPVDTTGYALVAALSSASIAVEAATLDHRVRALVLASPMPPRVELGRTAARLKSAHVPAFLQTTPSDLGVSEIAAQLYDFVDPHVSRLVDSDQAGSGVSVFVVDPGALPRLNGWLAERWTPKTGTRRPPPRKG